MTHNERLKWAMVMVFCVGFVAGQDYHEGFSAFLGFLIRLTLWCFVIYTALNLLHTNQSVRKEQEWKDPQSPPKKRPSSKGMGATVAAAVRATGTHVTVLEPRSPSPSSVECRHAAGAGKRPCGDLICESCYPNHPSRPGFAPEKRPDAGLDG